MIRELFEAKKLRTSLVLTTIAGKEDYDLQFIGAINNDILQSSD